MLAGLHAGRLDVVTLAAPPPPGDRSLASHSLGAEPLVLVTGEATALAERRRMTVGELDGVDLIKYPPGSAVGEIIAGALAAAGAQPRVRFETRDYTTARALVNVGLAAAIMPRSVARAPGPPVRVVELIPEPVWTPALAWSANRRPAPALETLIDFMVGHPDLALGGHISNV
jgi:DNA-binding transcriptional LysR family regulator